MSESVVAQSPVGVMELPYKGTGYFRAVLVADGFQGCLPNSDVRSVQERQPVRQAFRADRQAPEGHQSGSGDTEVPVAGATEEAFQLVLVGRLSPLADCLECRCS